jgi:DNA polymerase-4
MERRIVHMDLDSFYVSVERKLDSSLNGKPVIIGGTGDRAVVSSCSYEARAFGVHAAMSGKMAKQLCPHAIFIRGDMDEYSKYSNIVTDIIEEKAPLVEKASIDEHYLDISGMDKYIKNSMLWSQELRERIIKESGLPISFGLSENKTVSKVATGVAKPNGEKCVDSGIEKLFLAPLSIKRIPGVGDKTYMSLRNMGIEKIQTVQQMPMIMLQKAFGENGKVIWNKANGIDNSPVEPYTEQKSISKETTFQTDTTDVELLKNILISMVEELGFELRKSKKVAGCVVLKLRFSDFETHVFQASIPYTASDHLIVQKLMELFKKNFTRRVLIRLIGVKLTKLVNGQTQIDLFEDTQEMINLYQSLDKIKLRFGDKAVMKCVSLNDSKPKIIKKKSK